MEVANSLGKRKGDLQIERQKLQMEIDYRRNLVTDEKIFCDELTDFTGCSRIWNSKNNPSFSASF
jgi:hypothetical protein